LLQVTKNWFDLVFNGILLLTSVASLCLMAAFAVWSLARGKEVSDRPTRWMSLAALMLGSLWLIVVTLIFLFPEYLPSAGDNSNFH